MKLKMKKQIAIGLMTLLALTQAVPMEAAEKTLSLSLNKKSIDIYKEDKVLIKASLKNKTKKTKKTKILWSSKNKKIAKVSSGGKITGIKPGKTMIVATIKGSKIKANCKVTVGDYVNRLTLNSADTVVLKEGNTSQIKTEVSPSTALYSGVTYTSENEAIAVVDKKGCITGLSKGITPIFIETKGLTEKGKKLKKTITVVVNKEDKPKEEIDKEEGNQSGGMGGNPGDSGNNVGSKSPIVGSPTKSGSVTTYIIDKSYGDPVTVSVTINGQTWTKSGTVFLLLDSLATTYTSLENSTKTMKVERKEGEAWWTVTDLTNQTTLFRLKATTNRAENVEQGEVQIEEVNGSISIQIQ